MSESGQQTQEIPTGREPAPGELEILQRFVNTLDLEDGVEALGTPAGLRRWLAEKELLAPNARVEAADVKRAIALREAFRALLHANNGAPLDPDAVRTVDGAAELVVRFNEEGRGELVPARGGVEGAIGRLVAIAYRSQVEGTWQRLKACPETDCGWAFYDRSRNRSSTWCSMAVCGNRAKARAFRERQRRD